MAGISKFKKPFNCKVDNYSNGRYTFNPYWTCTHNCRFGCYSMRGYRWQYWSKRSPTPVAINFDQTLKDYTHLPSLSEIEISTSCDAFDLIYEKKYRITQKFLKEIIPLRKDIFLNFISKSNLIQRYIDFIPKKQSIIQITVESYLNKLNLSSPNASSYIERKECVKTLLENGFKTSIRIDPIIPSFDKKEDIINIINDFAEIGIKHITISFLKVFPVQVQDVEKNLNINLRNLLFQRKNKEFFIKTNLRKEFATIIKENCEKNDITLSMCRETEILEDNGLCDPFHLLPNYKINKKKESKFHQLTKFI